MAGPQYRIVGAEFPVFGVAGHIGSSSWCQPLEALGRIRKFVLSIILVSGFLPASAVAGPVQVPGQIEPVIEGASDSSLRWLRLADTVEPAIKDPMPSG
ncbi:MAG TPA: hypothetical protein VE397_04440, partial [Stellaceae bacterium]|nr:hypothetical protein [Stellaceae bacterium]